LAELALSIGLSLIIAVSDFAFESSIVLKDFLFFSVKDLQTGDFTNEFVLAAIL
jgi:hypothetical protein